MSCDWHAELVSMIEATRERIKAGESAFSAACAVLFETRPKTYWTPASIAWAAENPQPEGAPIFPKPEPMKRPPLHL